MGLRIEPNSVEIVVVVREAETGRVVQTHQCELRRGEGTK